MMIFTNSGKMDTIVEEDLQESFEKNNVVENLEEEDDKIQIVEEDNKREILYEENKEKEAMSDLDSLSNHDWDDVLDINDFSKEDDKIKIVEDTKREILHEENKGKEAMSDLVSLRIDDWDDNDFDFSDLSVSSLNPSQGSYSTLKGCCFKNGM